MADTEETWTDAYWRYVTSIEQHPDFTRLVREVAVAEAPDNRASWQRRNSRTFGIWASRGTSWPGQKPKGARAQALAQRMADQLAFWQDAPQGERWGLIYGTAAQHVRHRSRGGQTLRQGQPLTKTRARGEQE